MVELIKGAALALRFLLELVHLLADEQIPHLLRALRHDGRGFGNSHISPFLPRGRNARIIRLT